MTHLSRSLSALVCLALPALAVSLSYSSYLGGAGIDNATAVAVDPSGYIYVAGWMESGGGGGVDAFVTKLTSDGQTIVWSKALTGNGQNYATGLAADASGNVFVAGWTTSTNFPVQGAYQGGNAGGRDAFLTKLAGDGTVVFSTYFGGTGSDMANGIAVDSGGNIYLAGETTSSNLPVKNALQTAKRGGADAFVAKFTPSGDGLVFATYVGGSLDDRANAIAVDSNGNAYLTGDTFSSDFPTAGALQGISGGGQDAFVVKLGPQGSLLYSTYLGGSGGVTGLPESGRAIAVDAAGSAYVAGVTSSPDFPTVTAAQPQPAGGITDGFVAKLNPAGTGLVYSTYLGGSSVDSCSAIAVDGTGAAWIAGYTASTDLVMRTPAQGANGGLYDAFVVQLASNGGSIIQSTYLGGSASDAANGIALAGSYIYAVGQTASTDFPVIGGAVQGSLGGLLDGFVARFGLSPAQLVPILPCRVLDTRNAAGPFGGPALAAGETRSFTIPAGGCGIPSGVLAYAANVTVVPRGALGFLTVWPTGQPRPLVSTLNSLDGRVKANGAMVPAGEAGGVNMFATQVTDVILDLNGYFVPAGSGQALAFYPLEPCRILDTRGSIGTLGGPSLAAGVVRSIPVLSSACGVPAAARAYSLNLTAIPKGSLGYLTAWPGESPQPLVSTLNAPTGQVTANGAVIQAGPDGSINVVATNSTDAAADINGYFAAPGPGGLSFYAAAPCRVVDTRSPAGPFGAPAIDGLREFPISQSACGVPVADAYSLNATVVPHGFLAYLSLWSSGGAQPFVSTLNAYDGSIVSNSAVVPAASGSINTFTTQLTDLILDIDGYFAP